MLVRIVEEINILYNMGQYTAGLIMIKESLLLLKENHRDRALIKRIDNSLEIIRDSPGLTPSQKLSNQRGSEEVVIKSIANAIKGDFIKILWNGNYLVDEGYGMYYPAEDKRKIVPDLRRE